MLQKYTIIMTKKTFRVRLVKEIKVEAKDENEALVEAYTWFENSLYNYHKRVDSVSTNLFKDGFKIEVG